MAKTITVKLQQSIIDHGGPTTEVIVREPTCEEFFELGEPRTTVFTTDPSTKHLKTAGAAVEMKQVDNGPAIKRYLTQCIVKPDALLVFAQCSLADGMRIREEFLTFFELGVGVSVNAACNILVLDLKLCSPAECGKLSFSALDHWITQAIEKKLLNRK